MEKFERAARKKLRFDYKGQCSVEDLWDLSVEELDGIYQELAVEQEESAGKSLLKKASATNATLNLQVDIVKHIVEVKLAEDDAKKTRAANKMRKDKIAEILAKKQDQKLLDMDEDALKAEMEALG